MYSELMSSIEIMTICAFCFDDKVVFGKYSGTEVKLDGKEYLILKLEDILGVIA